MTYRLERCGIHVSGQCHGPTAKTVGEGKKREPTASPRPVRQRLGPWIVSHHASPQQTTNEGCEEQTQGGGALHNLKGFHPVNWKDIIFWPEDALCEAVHYGVKTQRDKEKKRRKQKKEVWTVTSAGYSIDKKCVCWLGFETLSVVSLCLKNKRPTFDIMIMFNATFIGEYWIVRSLQEQKTATIKKMFFTVATNSLQTHSSL